MANDNLRAALQTAGLQAEDLASIADVDIRTVRRWLEGRPPYTRHRAIIARALDTPEAQLWPELPQPASPETLIAYTSPEDPNVPSYESLTDGARDHIDINGLSQASLLAIPGLVDLLLGKAGQGCELRFLTAIPDLSLLPLLGHQRIEIRAWPELPGVATERFDDQILIPVPLAADPGQTGAKLHIRQTRAPELFNRTTRHFQLLWEHATHTLNTNQDLNTYLTEHGLPTEQADTDAATPVNDRAPTTAPADKPAQTPPRRWPRRPT